jgi:hypothetical protein
MTASGHERQGGASCRSSYVRNAPLATVGLKKAACREGPAATLAPPLFDHLVGDREQFIWNSEAEGFSRLKIDD